MYKLFLIFLLNILLYSLLAAQDMGLELIHADKTIGKKVDGEKIRFFEGNVHFQQDTLDMYCRKAIFFTDQNRTDFYGDVHIRDGHRNVWADKIEYYPENRLAVCLGNVIIADASDSLSAQYFSFNFNSKKAIADSNLYLYHREERVHIWGITGFYDPELESSEVESDAKLMRVDSTNTDTLIITSEKMEYKKSNPPFAMATDSVRIVQGAFSAVCDTAIFFPDDQILWLNQQPKAWFDNNELVGVRIKIGFDSVGLNQIDVYEKAKVINLVDSLADEWNILKGKEIHMDIKDKEPQQLLAMGSASSVYYLEEEKKDSGMNYATADTILVYFTEGKADSIYINGGAEGIYYPDEYKGVKTGAE